MKPYAVTPVRRLARRFRTWAHAADHSNAVISTLPTGATLNICQEAGGNTLALVLDGEHGREPRRWIL